MQRFSENTERVREIDGKAVSGVSDNGEKTSKIFFVKRAPAPQRRRLEWRQQAHHRRLQDDLH